MAGAAVRGPAIFMDAGKVGKIMTKKFAFALLCTASALVAGCGKKTPAGQVAATVNGDEVTLQEINTELQATQLPAGADKQTVQRALLQRVIDRKLLIGAAEDKKLDRTPEFLAQKRRMDELLLAQAYAKQQLTSVPVPTPGEIDTFMAGHPNVYGGRQIFTLDQIRFPTPKNPQSLGALAADHTMDAVGKRLQSLGINFERGATSLDSANVPVPVLDQVNKLPAGEPFVIPQPGLVTVNVITSRRPVTIDNGEARQGAARSWRQQKFADLLQQQLSSLKAGAKIRYQNGFGPPPPAPTQPAVAAKSATPPN